MAELRCPFCHEPCAADDPLRMACAACDAPHHAPCFQEGRGCAASGCRSTAARVGARTLTLEGLASLAEDPQGLERLRALPPPEGGTRWPLLLAAGALLVGPYLVGRAELSLGASAWGALAAAFGLFVALRVVRGGGPALEGSEPPAREPLVGSVFGAAVFLLFGLGALALVDEGRGPLALTLGVLGALVLGALALRPTGSAAERPRVVLRDEPQASFDPIFGTLNPTGFQPGVLPDQMSAVKDKLARLPAVPAPALPAPTRCPTCQGRLREPDEPPEPLAFCFHCGASLGPELPEAELAPGEEPPEKELPARAPREGA
mgnify:CR=1 FL=1